MLTTRALRSAPGTASPCIALVVVLANLAGQMTPAAPADRLPDRPPAFPLRIMDGPLRGAVLRAAGRSQTLAGLLERLGRFKAIVYVQWTPALPRELEAVTEKRVVVASDVRYVRIGIKPARVTDYLVSVLAHELWHAIEMLEAGATDPASMEVLYKQLSGGGARRIYETDAAVDVGLAVHRELRSARPR